jgi:hypothetical protein
LTYLYLWGNQLSGQIPKEIGNLIQLTYLNLGGNQLSGQIPKEIGNLIQLTHLNLWDNQLSGQIPPKLMQVCTQNKISNCFPPRICTAFNNTASSIDMQKCVSCVYSPLTIVILLLVTGILMIFAMRKFIKLIDKYPGSIGGTVASISILISHTQMMSVVSHMNLSWPGEVKKAQSLLNIFYLNLPEVVHVQCLFQPIDTVGMLFGVDLWFAVFGIFVIILFIPSCIKCGAKLCCKDSRNQRVDKLYNSLGLMMSLLAITFAKVVLAMYTLTGSGGWIILLIMFPFLFYIFFKYFREMRVLQGKWDGAMCRQCCPQNCCSFLFCLKPITMSKQRLKRRLNYLMIMHRIGNLSFGQDK